MTRSGLGKAAGFLRIIPSAVLLLGHLASLYVGFLLKKRKGRGYFVKGLMDAGMPRKEAEEIARKCYNGRG
jgi:hypothetical protein